MDPVGYMFCSRCGIDTLWEIRCENSHLLIVPANQKPKQIYFRSQ
jgi:hypothetical protein